MRLNPNEEVQSILEQTKDGFCEEAIQLARTLSWKAVDTIASRVQVGMTEAEAQAMASEVIRDLGAPKIWHRTYVRIGPNTVKAFGEPSIPDVKMGENDLFFVDIGPVFDGYEGDCGRTFARGDDDDMHRIAEDSQTLFAKVRDRWFDTGQSGVELYNFAELEAKAMGWVLGRKEADGHRLSDFPHHLYFKGNLGDRKFVPTANRWVLEIQLMHPTRPFGAFYEDLLF